MKVQNLVCFHILIQKSGSTKITSSKILPPKYQIYRSHIHFLSHYCYRPSSKKLFPVENSKIKYLLKITSRTGVPGLNPLHAKFVRENINIYSHFMSLLHIDMTHVLKIHPQVRPGPTYSTWPISWLLMSWRRKEPGHQQPWYWPS